MIINGLCMLKRINIGCLMMDGDLIDWQIMSIGGSFFLLVFFDLFLCEICIISEGFLIFWLGLYFSDMV